MASSLNLGTPHTSFLKHKSLIYYQRDSAKTSQVRIHSSQWRFIPPSHSAKQTSALAEREKQKIQLSHSLAEPRPPGSALRRRSKTAHGPRSFVNRWLSLKVASDPRMKTNQPIGFVQKSQNSILPLEAIVSLGETTLTKIQWRWRAAKSAIMVRAEDFLLYHLARRF